MIKWWSRENFEKKKKIGKENDEITQAPTQRVLKPVDWFKKYVDSSNVRSKDNKNKKGRTNSKKRRYRGMSSPKRPPVRKRTGGRLVKHKGHWHEVNKSKYPRTTSGSGGSTGDYIQIAVDSETPNILY